MKTSEAVRRAGSIRKLADLLGLSTQAVYRWGKEVPPLRMYQLREIFDEKRTDPGDPGKPS